MADAHGMTQAEVARQLGVSRARVWQIEREALAKLRKMPEAAVLLAYIKDFDKRAEA